MTVAGRSGASCTSIWTTPMKMPPGRKNGVSHQANARLPSHAAATALIRFTGETLSGLRRYRPVRDPAQFWGLYSEERLECPEGYRLQYQGIRLNIADEHGDDPDAEARSAEPAAAD